MINKDRKLRAIKTLKDNNNKYSDEDIKTIISNNVIDGKLTSEEAETLIQELFPTELVEEAE